MTATPPRADLRTLAAEAMWRWWHSPTCSPLADRSEDVRDEYHRAANAVLAAVLPEHRRIVLTEAANLLARKRDAAKQVGDREYAAAMIAARKLIEGLAAVAPPAGLSATVPAGNAPAVPEEADGQRAGQGDALTYGEMEAERDRLAGEVFTLTNSEGLAVVAAELERNEALADRDRLAAQVERVRAIHIEFDGRCAECVNYCDCIDRVTELGDDVEVAAAMRMCEHGNKPWPCPTIKRAILVKRQAVTTPWEPTDATPAADGQDGDGRG